MAATQVDGLASQVPRACLVAERSGDKVGLAAIRANLIHYFFAARCVAPGDNDVCPARRQVGGRRPADAAVAAGDQSRRAMES
jgi:hypothetical protein